MKTRRKISGKTAKSLQQLMREHDEACAVAAARRKVRVRTKQRRSLGYGEGNPLVSNSLGVHPDQVEQFNRIYKERGIAGAFHRPDGMLELTSKTARNRVMEVRSEASGERCFDMDAGYGDRAD